MENNIKTFSFPPAPPRHPQHNISFFQMKRDYEVKHEVIFGMSVLLFDPR